MEKPYNEPAFPHPGGSSDATVQQSYVGISARDYFAAHSVAVAYERAQKATGSDIERLFGPSRTNISIHDVTAKLAYKFADAMLKERD